MKLTTDNLRTNTIEVEFWQGDERFDQLKAFCRDIDTAATACANWTGTGQHRAAFATDRATGQIVHRSLCTCPECFR